MITVVLGLLSFAMAESVRVGVDIGPFEVHGGLFSPFPAFCLWRYSLWWFTVWCGYCGLIYLDPNSNTGTFECNEVTICSAHVDIEGVFRSFNSNVDGT